MTNPYSTSFFFFFSSRRRHTRSDRDWSSDVCSSDLIAAHDAEVFLVDHDLGAVEGAESRAVTEQLAGRFQALVVTFGSWFPDVAPSLVIIDPAALAPARARARHALLAELPVRTRPGC